MVDDKGFYSADLPIGLYKMTVATPTIGSQALTPYARLFRVKSSGTVTLNDALYMAHMTCDIMVGGSPEHQLEETKNACGGEDRFPLPSNDGATFELYIRFSNRSHTRATHTAAIGTLSVSPFSWHTIFSRWRPTESPTTARTTRLAQLEMW